MAICVGANGRLGIRERSFGRAQMVVWAGANGGKNVPLSQRGRISLPAGPYLSPSGVVPEMIFVTIQAPLPLVGLRPQNYKKSESCRWLLTELRR